MLKNTLYTAALFALLLLFAACEDDAATGSGEADVKAPAIPTEQAILGTWETIEIELDYTSFEARDTTVNELIREADFARVYGVKPPRTIFTPDGKSRRIHRMADGSVSNVVHGLWKVHNADTLLFIEPNKTFYFDYEMTTDRLTLEGMIDSDNDGAIDDHSRTVMRLVARDTYGG